MDESQAISAFSALSQETRLQIVRYLVACGEKGTHAGAIGEVAGAAASRLSFHLSALEHAGLVKSSRKSRQIIYRVDFEKLGALTSFLLHDCCRNHPTVKQCCTAKPDRKA